MKNLDRAKESKRKWHDGKLWYVSANGEHADDIKCTAVIGKYRLYAVHFECALPYTNYYIVDTTKNTVLEICDVHFTILSELKQELKEVQ